jgi:hypothetical protein
MHAFPGARNFKETVNAYMLPIIEGRFMVLCLQWSGRNACKTKILHNIYDDQIT